MQPDLDRALRDARAALADPDRARENSAVERFLAALPRRTPASRAALLATVAAVTLALTLGAFAAGVSPTREPALQQAAPVRVVDRTFSCLPTASTAERGVREVTLANRSFSRDDRGMVWPAELTLTRAAGPVFGSEFLLARSHQNDNRVRINRGYGLGHPGVLVNARACVPSRARIPLSRAGLPGPPLPSNTANTCRSTGRVLVRVRATLAAPARWGQLQQPYVGVRANVTDMAVSVRVERTGAPLLYAKARPAATSVWRADWPRCR
jgi:photosystem II stability/assembly factor-like uncharacterized protein